MKTNQRKVQMTVRLEPDVFTAAKEIERRTRTPRSVVIANAAKEVLLPRPHESPEQIMNKLSTGLLTRMGALERAFGKELHVLKELIALAARAYFNHTPAVPESQRDAASLSGRARFTRLIEQLDENVKSGASIFNETEVHDVT